MKAPAFSIWSSMDVDLSPEDMVLALEDRGMTVCELSDDHGAELLKKPGTPEEIGAAFGAFAAELQGIDALAFTGGIGENDFNTKLKNAQKFLADGNRVKVSVRFRGREMAHTEIGKELLDKFAEQCADMANLEKAAKMEGRSMSMFLSPKPQTPPKKPAKPKKEKPKKEKKEKEAEKDEK